MPFERLPIFTGPRNSMGAKLRMALTPEAMSRRAAICALAATVKRRFWEGLSTLFKFFPSIVIVELKIVTVKLIKLVQVAAGPADTSVWPGPSARRPGSCG